MTRRQNAWASRLRVSCVTSHLPRNLSNRRRAVTDQHEAREGTVHPDEERCHPRVDPEALDRRGVAVEAVVADGPVVDGGEVVEVELHETSQYRELLRTRLAKLDLHGVVLGYR